MDQFIHQRNIELFRRQLLESKDDVQRVVLQKLLAEEEAKAASLLAYLAALS